MGGMKKIYKSLILSVLSLVSGFFIFADAAFADPLASQSQKNVTIYVADSCPHCVKVEQYLDDNDVGAYFNITLKEVSRNRANAKEFSDWTDKMGVDIRDRGVPFMVVGNQYFVGDKPIINFFDEQIQKIKVQQELNKNNSGNGSGNGNTTGNADGNTSGNGSGDNSGNSNTGGAENNNSSSNKLTIPLIVGAALVDAIAPCEFAIMIILLSTMLAGGHRRRVLYTGFAFALALFLSYLAMGLGLYGAISSFTISNVFMKVIAVLAIVLGLMHLKDFFFYGKWFVMEVPMGWRPKMKAIARSVTSPIAAFGIGVAMSLFLLPCTGGPYIVIISMLGQKEEFGQAFWYLVFYNVIFILPLIIMTLLIYAGFSPDKAEEIRLRRLKIIHLIAGVILLVMGVVIFVKF